MKRRALFPGVLALLVPCLIAGPVPAPLTHANTTALAAPSALVVTVDTTTDSNEAAYQACTAAPGDCSLRGAISRANADAANEYTVLLPRGTYTLTLVGADEDTNTTGDLDVFGGTLTLTGEGASNTVIDAGRLDRVLQVHADADVTIAGVGLTNGRPPDDAGSRHGGGLCNAGMLDLSHCAVYSNTAGTGWDCSGYDCSAGGDGGGLYNGGTLEVAHSAVYSNTTGTGGGCTGSGCWVNLGGAGGGMVNWFSAPPG
jgi:hypothetical protein